MGRLCITKQGCNRVRVHDYKRVRVKDRLGIRFKG